MAIESYDRLNCLQEKSFIAGTELIEEFTVYNGINSNLLGITGASLIICPYGEISSETIVAGITGTCANSIASFTIADDISLPLSGKYIQQVTITDTTGKTFVPGQGIMLISPASE